MLRKNWKPLVPLVLIVLLGSSGVASAVTGSVGRIGPFGGSFALPDGGTMFATAGLATSGSTSLDSGDDGVLIHYEGFLRAVGRPILDLDPDSLEFLTDVIVGEADTASVTLTNKGGATIVMRNIGFDPAGDFHLPDGSADSLTVMPGVEAALEIVFAPEDSAGARQARLVADTNDPAFDGIKLLGTAVATQEQLAVWMVEAPDRVDLGGDIAVACSTNIGQSAMLYYRAGGLGDYEPVAMSGKSLDTEFEGVIPGDRVGTRGIEYYVEAHLGEASARAFDTDGEIGPNTPNRIVVTGGAGLADGLPELAYRNVSVPLETEDDPVAVFGLGDYDPRHWRFGRYLDEADSVVEYPDDGLDGPLRVASGYWIITRAGAAPAVSGSSVFPPRRTDTAFPIPLAPVKEDDADGAAWTQIGMPFAYEVPWDSCRVRCGGDTLTVAEAAEDSLLENAAYDYVGKESDPDSTEDGFREADVLRPWSGYFVATLTSDPCTLLVPAREAPSGKILASTALQPGEWHLRLTSRADGSPRSGVTLGVRADASAGWDAHDRLRAPPPVDPGRRVGVSIRGVRPVLAADFRPPSDEIQAWRIEVSLGEETEVTLSGDVAPQVPKGYEILFVDEQGATTRAVTSGFEYRFVSRPGETQRLVEVVYGPVGLLEDRGFQPTEREITFYYGRPHPNPFGKTTFIRYATPAEGRVRLSAFDTSGRLVQRIFDGVQPPGEHLVKWGGSRISSGVYFIRLEYGGRIETRRVIRVR